jgi:HAMP domain-containing protein
MAFTSMSSSEQPGSERKSSQSPGTSQDVALSISPWFKWVFRFVNILILSIWIILIAMSFSYTQTAISIVDSAVVAARHARMAQTANTLATSIEKGFFERFRELDLIGRIFKSSGASAAISAIPIITQAATSGVDYNWIGVVSPNGSIIANTTAHFSSNALADSQFFIQGREREHIADRSDPLIIFQTVSKQRRDKPFGFVEISRPAHLADGVGVVGAVLCAAWMADLRDTLSADLTDTSFQLYVLDSGGATIIAPSSTSIKSLTLSSAFSSPWGPPSLHLNGDTFLLATSKAGGYRTFGGSNWTVAVIESAEVARALVRDIQTKLRIWGGVFLVIGMVVSVAISLAVTRPLNTLTAVAKRVDASQPNLTLPVIGSFFEMRLFSATLRRLIARLAAETKERERHQRAVSHQFRRCDSLLRLIRSLQDVQEVRPPAITLTRAAAPRQDRSSGRTNAFGRPPIRRRPLLHRRRGRKQPRHY